MVGAGVVGASIAYHLATAGLRVVVCEQAEPLQQGATSRSGGLVRMHHTDPDDARLALLSLPVFERWAEAVGGSCGYQRTGFALLVDGERVGALRANLAMLTALGVDTRQLTADELAEICPELRLAGVAAAAWEPRSGYVDPRQVCRSYLDRAVDRGAQVRTGDPVRRLDVARGRVRGVLTQRSAVTAGAVVIAAGAWSAELLRRSGVPLPVTPRRISIAVAGRTGSNGAAPCTVIDDTTGLYFRPDGTSRVLFGVATGRPEAAAGDETAPPPAAVAAAHGLLAQRLRAVAAAPPTTGVSAVDGYTPDRRPLIGPLPGLAGGYLSTGFSGGGAKSAPAVGAAVAAELAGHPDRPELRRYRLDRFAAPPEPAAPHPYLHL